MLSTIAVLFSLAGSFAAASVLPEAHLNLERAEAASTTATSVSAICTNGPTTRDCWSDGFTIATDSEVDWPETGVTVKYTLVITNQTLAPDGTPRQMLVVNGTYPGPTLTANWGDKLEITVINQMTNNGTSIHWHGFSQINSSIMDGTNGVTECPIAPGASRTYLFQATEYGTSWYHSHYSGQYGDGVLGPMIINGPASANYDIDLGAMPITDFYYLSMYDETLIANLGPPPVAPNGLINGTMMNPTKTAGAYNNVTLTPGKKHRLRLINTSTDNNWYVSLDSHAFQVIQSDFVAINNYNTTWLFIAIGQRYDVIIYANETASNYWFRAETDNCGNVATEGNVSAIFNYDSVPIAVPDSTAWSGPTFACVDESELVPYVVKSVPKDNFTYTAQDSLPLAIATVNGIQYWTVNGSAIDVTWGDPTLLYVKNGNTTFPTDLNVIKLPDANVWSFWVIQNTAGAPHPVHIHGHDFYVLGAAADSTFTEDDIDLLNFTNPPRRDVAFLPGTGWLVVAFITDNPGAWLMHCHIAFHVGEGLAVQFLERESEIPSVMSLDNIPGDCSVWDDWYADTIYKQYDSGL